MRKLKEVNVDGRSYEVMELTVKQVWGLFDGAGAETTNENSIAAFLALGCPKLDYETMLEMAPSDLMTLWRAFKEVNADFLETARMFGGEDILNNIVASVKTTVLSGMQSSEPSAS